MVSALYLLDQYQILQSLLLTSLAGSNPNFSSGASVVNKSPQFGRHPLSYLFLNIERISWFQSSCNYITCNENLWKDLKNMIMSSNNNKLDSLLFSQVKLFFFKKTQFNFWGAFRSTSKNLVLMHPFCLLTSPLLVIRYSLIFWGRDWPPRPVPDFKLSYSKGPTVPC